VSRGSLPCFGAFWISVIHHVKQLQRIVADDVAATLMLAAASRLSRLAVRKFEHVKGFFSMMKVARYYASRWHFRDADNDLHICTAQVGLSFCSVRMTSCAEAPNTDHLTSAAKSANITHPRAHRISANIIQDVASFSAKQPLHLQAGLWRRAAATLPVNGGDRASNLES
jgi:hypothetical protein